MEKLDNEELKTIIGGTEDKKISTLPGSTIIVKADNNIETATDTDEFTDF